MLNLSLLPAAGSPVCAQSHLGANAALTGACASCCMSGGTLQKVQPRHALLVCRATVTPFLANMTVGRDNFKWMLFGDDDTVSRSLHLHKAALLSDAHCGCSCWC